MIQFMPFTYLSETLVDRLTAALGPLAVWQPLAVMVPAHLRARVEQGRLHVRLPAEVDPVQLSQAVQAFRQWADLHQGKLGDLTAVSRSGHGPAVWSQEADAHQIRDQIRRRSDTVSSEANPELFQAALFLCLAHTYDQQQDALTRELGSVRHLEEQFGRILGETDDRDTSLGPAVSPAAEEKGADRGLFMTERRMHSWARVAKTQTDPDRVYITTSGAVWAQLMELFPDALPVLDDRSGPVDPAARSKASFSSDELAATLTALTLAEDPRTAAKERRGAGTVGEGNVALTLRALVGCSPQELFSRILEEDHVDGGSRSVVRHAPNTVIGYLRA
ncbi:MAG: hypothetical protein WAU91_05265 [Desulfatitalea sp.]